MLPIDLDKAYLLVTRNVLELYHYFCFHFCQKLCLLEEILDRSQLISKQCPVLKFDNPQASIANRGNLILLNYCLFCEK